MKEKKGAGRLLRAVKSWLAEFEHPLAGFL